jgi:hypothetical protein
VLSGTCRRAPEVFPNSTSWPSLTVRTTYDHHATLRHEERDALGTSLQDVLVDLTDLALAGQQLLDELVESARDLAIGLRCGPALSPGVRTAGATASHRGRTCLRCRTARSPIRTSSIM